MRTQVVEVQQAVGKLLSTPVFQSSGKKLLAKGRLISPEDIRLLESAGHRQVAIAILEENEVPEEEAATSIAKAGSGGSLEVRLGAGGRANILAARNGTVLVAEESLRKLNLSGHLTMATLPNFSYAVQGQRIGTVKTAPFAVPKAPLSASLSLLEQSGPVVELTPIEQPNVGVLYSDPVRGERARTLFEGIMRTRLERFGASAAFVLSSIEEEEPLARNIEHLIRAKPTLLLIASTTAPAGPNDVVGRAMRRVGCRIESFLAPVEPGNLLLLSYSQDIPVVAAPGCFRSPRPNAVDLVLPPLLAQYPMTASEISAFGHGGLLH